MSAYEGDAKSINQWLAARYRAFVDDTFARKSAANIRELEFQQPGYVNGLGPATVQGG